MNGNVITMKEVILTVVIAIICGVLYTLWGPVYDLIGVLTAGFVKQLVYGVWFIASIIAAYIIRKPGVALFAGIAAASGEVLMGLGLGALISGIAQSIGPELVLLVTRYKRWNLGILMLMSLAACAGSLIIDYTFWGYGEKTTFVQVMSIIFRSIGSLFVCGWFGKVIADAIAKTGVLNSYAIVRSEQKAKWDQV